MPVTLLSSPFEALHLGLQQRLDRATGCLPDSAATGDLCRAEALRMHAGVLATCQLCACTCSSPPLAKQAPVYAERADCCNNLCLCDVFSTCCCLPVSCRGRHAQESAIALQRGGAGGCADAEWEADDILSLRIAHDGRWNGIAFWMEVGARPSC